MLHYLESNRLITNSQHGFRPKLSTETDLTVITDNIYNNMDNKSIRLLTLCDLSKAFDSVSHSIILSKCTHLNIDSFWFNDYVSNITQSVRLNNIVSQYADDTQFLLTSTIDNLNHLIRNTESTLLRLKRYFLRNCLLLNPAKTQCIFFGNRPLLFLIPPDT